MPEDDFLALRAMPRRNARENLAFQVAQLRIWVQQSPILENLDPWDASIIPANEARISNIEKFVSEIDKLILEGSLSETNADDLMFMFERSVSAAFEIGSVCNPSGSAREYVGRQQRKKQSKGAQKGKSAQRDARAERVRSIVEAAERKANGSLKNPTWVGSSVAKKLGVDHIDPKTLKSYVAYIDKTRKTDINPGIDRED